MNLHDELLNYDLFDIYKKAFILPNAGCNEDVMIIPSTAKIYFLSSILKIDICSQADGEL